MLAEKTLYKKLIFLLMLGVSAFVAYPLLLMIGTSLKSENELYLNSVGLLNSFHFENYVRVWQEADLTRLSSQHELDLLRKVGELPETIAEAARIYAPHAIIRYVYELASQFHSYYKAERVITEDAEQSQARLQLLAAIRITIANALALVGVSAPDKM